MYATFTRIARFGTIFTLLAVLANAGWSAAQETARVARVIDGDTVVLENGETVRYIGMNAPEVRRRHHGKWRLDPQPFGPEATAENRRMVAGKPVRIELDTEWRDRFGRLLAYVYVDGTMVNEHLVRMGLARAKAYPPNTRHHERMVAAQRDARQHKRGIWRANPLDQ